MEVAAIKGKDAVHILRDGYGALLTVDDFVGAVFPVGPVHHVQRESLQDGINDRVALLVLVDELPLERRSYVQPAAIPEHAAFAIVAVVHDQLPDGHLSQLNLHVLGPFRRMTTRAYFRSPST